MTNMSNSVAPQGAGGKDTSHFNPDTDRALSDGEMGNFADHMSGARNQLPTNPLLTREQIVEENLLRSARNAKRASRRVDPNYIEEVSEDEDPFPFDNVPTTSSNLPTRTKTPVVDQNSSLAHALSAINALTPSSKAVFHSLLDNLKTSDPTPPSSQSNQDAFTFDDSNVKIASSIENIYELPRVIINLAKAKIHVPLTLLTPSAIQKIHTEPSSIKLRKGLVLDDPKQSVLDTSGFPSETDLTPEEFYEASDNFVSLISLIAGPAVVQRFKQHRSFCLSRKQFKDSFPAILAFDIETRRMFFNTQTFLTDDAYERRWNETQLKLSQKKADDAAELAIRESARLTTLLQQGSSSQRYAPYPSKKADTFGDSSAGGPFRRGKGTTSSDTSLCLLRGRTGHRASGCTHTHTVKNNPVFCMWADKLVAKASNAVVCISFNFGKCNNPKHSSDIIHACSICGNKSHNALSKSCC